MPFKRYHTLKAKPYDRSSRSSGTTSRMKTPIGLYLLRKLYLRLKEDLKRKFGKYLITLIKLKRQKLTYIA
jgi:hypothetical protein